MMAEEASDVAIPFHLRQKLARGIVLMDHDAPSSPPKEWWLRYPRKKGRRRQLEEAQAWAADRQGRWAETGDKAEGGRLQTHYAKGSIASCRRHANQIEDAVRRMQEDKAARRIQMAWRTILTLKRRAAVRIIASILKHNRRQRLWLRLRTEMLAVARWKQMEYRFIYRSMLCRAKRDFATAFVSSVIRAGLNARMERWKAGLVYSKPRGVSMTETVTQATLQALRRAQAVAASIIVKALWSRIIKKKLEKARKFSRYYLTRKRRLLRIRKKRRKRGGRGMIARAKMAVQRSRPVLGGFAPTDSARSSRMTLASVASSASSMSGGLERRRGRAFLFAPQGGDEEGRTTTPPQSPAAITASISAFVAAVAALAVPKEEDEEEEKEEEQRSARSVASPTPRGGPLSATLRGGLKLDSGREPTVPSGTGPQEAGLQNPLSVTLRAAEGGGFMLKQGKPFTNRQAASGAGEAEALLSPSPPPSTTAAASPPPTPPHVAAPPPPQPSPVPPLPTSEVLDKPETPLDRRRRFQKDLEDRAAVDRAASFTMRTMRDSEWLSGHKVSVYGRRAETPEDKERRKRELAHLHTTRTMALEKEREARAAHVHKMLVHREEEQVRRLEAARRAADAERRRQLKEEMEREKEWMELLQALQRDRLARLKVEEEKRREGARERLAIKRRQRADERKKARQEEEEKKHRREMLRQQEEERRMALREKRLMGGVMRPRTGEASASIAEALHTDAAPELPSTGATEASPPPEAPTAAVEVETPVETSSTVDALTSGAMPSEAVEAHAAEGVGVEVAAAAAEEEETGGSDDEQASVIRYAIDSSEEDEDEDEKEPQQEEQQQPQETGQGLAAGVVVEEESRGRREGSGDDVAAMPVAKAQQDGTGEVEQQTLRPPTLQEEEEVTEQQQHQQHQHQYQHQHQQQTVRPPTLQEEVVVTAERHQQEEAEACLQSTLVPPLSEPAPAVTTLAAEEESPVDVVQEQAVTLQLPSSEAEASVEERALTLQQLSSSSSATAEQTPGPSLDVAAVVVEEQAATLHLPSSSPAEKATAAAVEQPPVTLQLPPRELAEVAATPIPPSPPPAAAAEEAMAATAMAVQGRALALQLPSGILLAEAAATPLPPSPAAGEAEEALVVPAVVVEEQVLALQLPSGVLLAEAAATPLPPSPAAAEEGEQGLSAAEELLPPSPVPPDIGVTASAVEGEATAALQPLSPPRAFDAEEAADDPDQPPTSPPREAGVAAVLLGEPLPSEPAESQQVPLPPAAELEQPAGLPVVQAGEPGTVAAEASLGWDEAKAKQGVRRVVVIGKTTVTASDVLRALTTGSGQVLVPPSPRGGSGASKGLRLAVSIRAAEMPSTPAMQPPTVLKVQVSGVCEVQEGGTPLLHSLTRYACKVRAAGRSAVAASSSRPIASRLQPSVHDEVLYISLPGEESAGAGPALAIDVFRLERGGRQGSGPIGTLSLAAAKVLGLLGQSVVLPLAPKEDSAAVCLTLSIESPTRTHSRHIATDMIREVVMQRVWEELDSRTPVWDLKLLEVVALGPHDVPAGCPFLDPRACTGLCLQTELTTTTCNGSTSAEAVGGAAATTDTAAATTTTTAASSSCGDGDSQMEATAAPAATAATTMTTDSSGAEGHTGGSQVHVAKTGYVAFEREMCWPEGSEGTRMTLSWPKGHPSADAELRLTLAATTTAAKDVVVGVAVMPLDEEALRGDDDGVLVVDVREPRVCVGEGGRVWLAPVTEECPVLARAIFAVTQRLTRSADEYQASRVSAASAQEPASPTLPAAGSRKGAEDAGLLRRVRLVITQVLRKMEGGGLQPVKAGCVVHWLGEAVSTVVVSASGSTERDSACYLPLPPGAALLPGSPKGGGEALAIEVMVQHGHGTVCVPWSSLVDLPCRQTDYHVLPGDEAAPVGCIEEREVWLEAEHGEGLVVCARLSLETSRPHRTHVLELWPMAVPGSDVSHRHVCALVVHKEKAMWHTVRVGGPLGGSSPALVPLGGGGGGGWDSGGGGGGGGALATVTLLDLGCYDEDDDGCAIRLQSVVRGWLARRRLRMGFKRDFNGVGVSAA